MSPTVEPDPDNAGGGRMHNQAALYPGGFFISRVQSSAFKVPGFVFRAAGVRKNKD
jgi:hypothetical protein